MDREFIDFPNAQSLSGIPRVPLSRLAVLAFVCASISFSSLILGIIVPILGGLILLAFPGLVLGLVCAARLAGKTQIRGRELAIASVWLSVIPLCLLAFVAFIEIREALG